MSMMGRRRGVVVGFVVVGLLSLAQAAGAASGGWTKISRDALSGTSQPTVTASGASAIVAWHYSSGANADNIEATTFTPTLAHTVTAQSTAPVVVNWTRTESDPVLMNSTGGGVQVAFSGARTSDSAEPSTGILIATRAADGSWSAPVVAVAGTRGRFGGYGLGAVTLPDATPLLSGDCCGGLSPVYRGVNPDADGIEANDAGTSSTSRTLARDGAGNVWLAWYSAASGVHMRQIDPATGAPLAPSVAVPDSANIYNPDARMQLVCNPVAAGCRVVYKSVDGLRVLTFAPGDPRPILLGNAPPKGGLGAVGAAYDADGRLWVAWQSRFPLTSPTVMVTRGDATGAGGVPFAIGQPAGTISIFQMALQPMGPNVLVVANAATDPSKGSATWANLVGISPQADTSGPVDVEIQAGPGGKGFRIQVQFRVPAACGTSCVGRSEIRVRTATCDARCLATVRGTRIRGDGRLVLGRRGRVVLPGGRKIRFYLVVDRAAILRAPFHTEGGFRVGDTRLRVWIRTSAGESLAVRDGHIKVSIARIKSGALPALKGIL
jgi:hypothetical protein